MMMTGDNADFLQICTISISAMNTRIEVLCRTDGETMHEAAVAAQMWFRTAEERFSRFRPGSELSQLNRLAGERCLVSDAMLEVLQLAGMYRQKTNGVFDPLLLAQLERLGYDRSYDEIKDRREFEIPTWAGNSGTSRHFAGWELDPIMRSVRFPAHAKLDLSGIVKSWTVGKLAEHLQAKLGVEQGLINAGGDLLAWGGSSDSDEPWLVGIEHPWEPQADIGMLMLTGGAAATSSTLGRSWDTNLGKRHHLIDPRTGDSASSGVVQCTVVGPEAVECEIWSKAMCILGLEEGLKLMQFRARHYEAALFMDDRRVIWYGEEGSVDARWRGLPIDSIKRRWTI